VLLPGKGLWTSMGTAVAPGDHAMSLVSRLLQVTRSTSWTVRPDDGEKLADRPHGNRRRPCPIACYSSDVHEEFAA
jgi:hypothetical protein